MTNKPIFLFNTFLFLRAHFHNKISFVLIFETILLNKNFLQNFLLNKIITKPHQIKILLFK